MHSLLGSNYAGLPASRNLVGMESEATLIYFPSHSLLSVAPLSRVGTHCCHCAETRWSGQKQLHEGSESIGLDAVHPCSSDSRGDEPRTPNRSAAQVRNMRSAFSSRSVSTWAWRSSWRMPNCRRTTRSTGAASALLGCEAMGRCGWLIG